MTEFWRFLEDIQTNFMSTFDPNHSSSNMLFDLFIVYLGIACPILGIFISCHYIFFPYWPCYLTSFVPLEYRSTEVLMLNGIVYFYGLQVVWAVLLSQAICFLTYGWYFWQISHEYCCFPDNPRGPPGLAARRIWRHQKTDPAFRTFEEFPVRYRQLQILHLNFQEVFSSMIMPFQATITYLGVFCNFSLIKHKDNLSLTNTLILLLWSVGATAIALISLTYCGTMYSKSVRTLNTVKNKDWGSSYKNKVMRKIVRSCNPISYGYGRMYVIRMLSVFKYVKHLTRGTFRALLTLYK